MVIPYWNIVNNIAVVYFDIYRVLCDFASQAEKYKVLKKNLRINSAVEMGISFIYGTMKFIIQY